MTSAPSGAIATGTMDVRNAARRVVRLRHARLCEVVDECSVRTASLLVSLWPPERGGVGRGYQWDSDVDQRTRRGSWPCARRCYWRAPLTTSTTSPKGTAPTGHRGSRARSNASTVMASVRPTPTTIASRRSLTTTQMRSARSAAWATRTGIVSCASPDDGSHGRQRLPS